MTAHARAQLPARASLYLLQSSGHSREKLPHSNAKQSLQRPCNGMRKPGQLSAIPPNAPSEVPATGERGGLCMPVQAALRAQDGRGNPALKGQAMMTQIKQLDRKCCTTNSRDLLTLTWVSQPLFGTQCRSKVCGEISLRPQWLGLISRCPCPATHHVTDTGRHTDEHDCCQPATSQCCHTSGRRTAQAFLVRCAGR